MVNCNCKSCQGEIISSKCISWEGKNYNKTFEEVVESVSDYVLEETNTQKLDIKTLSNKIEISKNEIIQILIDRIIAIEKNIAQLQTSSSNFKIDVSSINSCDNCNLTFLQSLEVIVDKLKLHETEINQLKETVY